MTMGPVLVLRVVFKCFYTSSWRLVSRSSDSDSVLIWSSNMHGGQFVVVAFRSYYTTKQCIRDVRRSGSLVKLCQWQCQWDSCHWLRIVTTSDGIYFSLLVSPDRHRVNHRGGGPGRLPLFLQQVIEFVTTIYCHDKWCSEFAGCGVRRSFVSQQQ